MTATRKLLMLCLASTLAAAACDRGDGNEAGANQAGGGEKGAAQRTIGEALAAEADHRSFVQAIESAGMREALRGAGPYTIFAPTNAAFAAIPAETRQSLMAPEGRRQLTALLSFHIVPGTVTAEDLDAAIQRGQSGRAELATVGGGNLSLSREGEAIIVSDGAGGRARLARADQIHSNGVVHSIDAVLMPAAPEARPAGE